MNKHPKVFIVILNYNDGKETSKNCLKSVFSISYPNFQVIVSDNGSEDGSLELAQSEFPEVCFLKNNKNFGFAKGNNIGIDKALKNSAEYVLLLNNDVFVKSDFLSHLIKIGEENESAGLLCPLIYKGDKKNVWFSGGKINWFNMKAIHETEIIKDINLKSDFISGCALLIKRKVFEKIGFLDEKYFLYWEDIDFSFQAKKAGFNLVVVPKSAIYHFEQSNAISYSNKKIYYLVLSGLIFFKKNSSFFIKLWINFYVFLRKIKNFIDRKIRKIKIAEVVYKAYNDFQNVKF